MLLFGWTLHFNPFSRKHSLMAIFYNFGNNARKFLELHLYYKYPDNTKDEDKPKKSSEMK